MSGFQMKFKKRVPDFKKPPKKVASLHTGAGYPLERRPGTSTKPDRQTAVASSDSSSEEDFVERQKSQQVKENEEKSEQAAIVERALLEQVMNGQLNLMDLLNADPAAKGILQSKLTPEMLKELQNRESGPPPHSRESSHPQQERRHSAERQHQERPAPPPVVSRAPPVSRPPVVSRAPPVVSRAPPVVSRAPPVSRPPAPPVVTMEPPVVPALSVASISSESDSASDLSISSESYTDSDDTENPIKLKKRVKKLRGSNKKLKKSVKKMKKKMKARDKTIQELQGAAAAAPVKEQRRANVVKPQQKPPEDSRPSPSERSRGASESSKDGRDPDRSRTRESRDESHRSKDGSDRSRDESRRDESRRDESRRDESRRDESRRDESRRDESRRESPSRKHRKHRTERAPPEAAPAAPALMTALPNQQIYDPQTGQYRTIPSLQVPMGPMPPLSALGMMPPLSSVVRPPLLACPPGPPPPIASLLPPSQPTPSLLPTPSDDDLYSDVFNSSPPKREVRSFTEAPKVEPKVRNDSGGDSTERDSRGYSLCLHCKKFHSKNVRCRKQAMQHAEQIKTKTDMKKMTAIISERERELDALKKKKELRERIKADSFARGYSHRDYSSRSDVYDIDDVDQDMSPIMDVDMDGECLDGEEYTG